MAQQFPATTAAQEPRQSNPGRPCRNCGHASALHVRGAVHSLLRPCVAVHFPAQHCGCECYQAKEVSR
jgi:hypothetical protein